jgi:hypothetical protein
LSRYTPALAAAAVAMLLTLPAATAAENLEEMERPSHVPKFDFVSMGDGVVPGGASTYGFDLLNRYNASMGNVTVTIELYMWATQEEAKAIAGVGRPPWFESTGGLGRTLHFASIGPNETVEVREVVRAAPETPEGVYFTRHTVEFDYSNFTAGPFQFPETRHFVMKSRGYFTQEEFESINYSDLAPSLAALNVSGIVPDSSLSVKSPVPLWPLAIVVGLAAATGGLAYASYLADLNPDKYPRLKRQLLRWSGAVRVRRVLFVEGVRERVGRAKR